jgi:response regulator RpfG family c-di-GMP phosphodiesterase
VKRNFVVVAHDEKVREALAGALTARGYSVTRAANARQAEQIVRSVFVDAVIVESNLPDVPPEKLRARLARLRPKCRTLVMTGFERIRNTPEQLAFGDDAFVVRSQDLLDLIEAPYRAEQDEQTGGFAEKGNNALIQALDVVVGLVELDDRHFGGFSHRAMALAGEIALQLGADQQLVHEVSIATLLRDLGKAGVESDVLDEKGWYSSDQRERMKTHVEGSLRLFEHIDFPWKVLPIIRHHHERYDGNGYPEGLSGPEIPLGARILAVVDAYVALTSDRSHRESLDSDEALATLVAQAGRQFDPEVVEAFQKALDARRVTLGARRKPRVLIVAPQDDYRRVIKLGLVNEGLRVTETVSFKTASSKVGKKTVDMAVVDLDADEQEAFRFLRETREDPERRHVPVIFVTRRTDRILKIRALREGADDCLDKGEDLELSIARLQNTLARESTRGSRKTVRARRGIRGDLESFTFADIVQMLSIGMKTARVTLSTKGRTASVWFENGAARHAESNGSKGERAFFDAIGWPEGSFVIEHGVRAEESSIDNDAMFLLMEGMRLIDEAGEQETRGSSAVVS